MSNKSKATALNVKLEDLVLDIKNPRFAELYSGSSSEDDLIEYLLYTEAAEDVATAIVKVGEFYPDRPLWVLKEGNKYLVKDGNRRCSAVKALQMPGKYKLGLAKTTINELPVLLYTNQSDIDERIIEEHAGSLFRRWERIAKALEVLKLADSGRWNEAQELDSKSGDLIKLASFYKAAVVHGGDDLRQLLRRGRGKSGGKTIIFERLFRDAKLCGYQFKKSPSFRIEVTDAAKFELYIKAMVEYLKKHPDTTTETVDNDKNFIKRLSVYGFDAYTKATTTGSSSATGTSGAATSSTGTSGASSGSTGSSSTSTGSSPGGSTGSSTTSTGSTTGGGAASSGGSTASGATSSRGSVKKYPILKRKGMPPGLKSRIQEYFTIDSVTEPNSKIAMARVTFECVLKYVVENTKFNGRTTMDKSGYFGGVFRRPPFADFTLMKSKFTDLITKTGVRTAFIAFDLDRLHTIVHNYLVNAVPTDGEQISHNLMELIEFMLQDEADLLASLDLSKL